MMASTIFLLQCSASAVTILPSDRSADHFERGIDLIAVLGHHHGEAAATDCRDPGTQGTEAAPRRWLTSRLVRCFGPRAKRPLVRPVLGLRPPLYARMDLDCRHLGWHQQGPPSQSPRTAPATAGFPWRPSARRLCGGWRQ